MQGGLGFVVLVLVILVAIAPRQVLGPVYGLVRRTVGVGVVALVSLSVGSYALGVAGTERARWLALGTLALGGACAVVWIYRLFKPRYRDQAPASEPAHGDR